MIDPNRVTEILVSCLFQEDEVVDGKPTSEPVYAHGVMNNMGFHAERLKSFEGEINGLLDQLPPSFYVGDSFLHMCLDKEGNQWGEQNNVDELCLLGNAIGRLSFPLPREMWRVLPGSVPMIVIKPQGVVA